MRETINGGHCPGLDSGAVGATGLQEAVAARDVMQRVSSYLRVIGHEVLEVQENELYQITDASNQFGADLFVSIHCNAASSSAAQGTETYCYSLGGQGEKLARCIQNQIVNSLGTVDRGVKTANFYVLRNTDCPAVLVEMAFISNPDDEKLLADAGKRDEFARAIARGITDYLQ
ncbi:N-acetylmuramoyl-L-alanine amidase family protein [Sporomusa acidovorans]|uniref:N-acetylmuramoyl-L-alanine amidase LytC n=1 Tax=Sporomusa acidovorans (strain ATCC 49682 / DSM 3132 / Mol) TaxID=1123286 RepID=A0ABZ3J6F1_SPOA4|nr:N-acetylmuramoyl-L-alanine amidase [Sporomusa acidovorans]OZC23829.1 N-acetylmuramoyl-L-alanine amidase LytC precursor [Sporomusa acidovorans DSM 3132]SDF62391.1 N-acetylmuramoyl-L-alanine amidase [Sporomusa acidovorans]